MVVPILESRLRGALWGLFAGDALAAPTHWYYGGSHQISSDYGPGPITTYVQPVTHMAGSIMNKSNTNGGGRGSYRKIDGVSIIGDVINHGKREYWDPTKSIHYHATLAKGENTLEVQLVRVLMKSIVANGGKFSADHFRKAYVEFMTTPGSHNDTYASTCHRMFFANLTFQKLPPEQCPDNDQHNVDTIDGLILPTITALAYAARGEVDVGAEQASQTAAVTRSSPVLERYSSIWTDLIDDSLHSEGSIEDALVKAAKGFGMRQTPRSNGRDEMSACYLQGSIPTLLDLIAKYTSTDSDSGRTKNDAWTGLLANANVGGENVHRGSVLGAVLGARAGVENMPVELFDGLHDRDELAKEIDAFVEAVLGSNDKEL